MLVDGVYERERALRGLREHPVDVLLDVAVLLQGKGHVVKQHVQSLLRVVHAQFVERGSIPRPCQFPVLEPRRVQNVDTGTGLCRCGALESSVDQHHQGRHSLLIEPHHKRVECSRTVSALCRYDRGPVGVDGASVAEVEVRGLGGGAEEVGDAEGGSSRRVEDVLPEVLVVDAEDDGSSLGSCRVQETLTTSHRTCGAMRERDHDVMHCFQQYMLQTALHLAMYYA